MFFTYLFGDLRSFISPGGNQGVKLIAVQMIFFVVKPYLLFDDVCNVSGCGLDRRLRGQGLVNCSGILHGFSVRRPSSVVQEENVVS